MELILLYLVAAANLLLGFFVLKNQRKALNVSFFIMTLFIVSWAMCNYYAEVTTGSLQLYLTRLTYLSSMGIAELLFIFTMLFPKKVKRFFKPAFIISVLASSIVVAICLTSYMVVSVEVLDGIITIHNGTLFPVYLFIFSLTSISALFLLFYRYIKTRGIVKTQILYVLTGTFLVTILATITSIVIPALTQNYELSTYGPLMTVFFVGFTSYSIIKHRLMDIRMVVARSVTYTILIAILAGFYAGVILAAQAFIFPNADYSVGYIALQILLAIIMAFSFQPLRRWITKVTDRIFFKNAYDKDELLSQLSHTLGSTIVLIEMLYKVSDILTQEMKASRTLFALTKDENRLYTVQANGYKVTPEVDPKDIAHITKDGIMIADELPDNSAHKRMLRDYDAAIAIPLKTEKEVVGVLFLGEKSSGDMYSQQDLSLLEIIAPEISVAIENAKSYEEINRFNVTLRQEVKHATSRLKLKNEQLMELDKAKDEFISMASHQLRTPLTAIKGYLSMLLEGDAGDIKVSQYDFINEAYSGANRMVGLINDLLNVSRMETGRFFLEPKELDIERVVNEEVKQLSNAARAKGLYLKVEAKGKVPHIWADETKIRQVVMNFMDNALYYTNTGGVTVVLRHDKKDFIYEVHDTGIGVPRAQVEHLFEKFFRADNARTARPDGTGLGIYLAKRVVEDHGGEIIFDSVEGKGSMFGFRFPLKKKVESKVASAPNPRELVPPAQMPMATEIAELNKTE